MLPWKGIPEPSLQEDFSYLLSGDTFASGRLANPAHPMAVHFETLQVLQKPTYSSSRPPGQGLFLALGEVLVKNAWAGVLISVGAFCAGMCWMLQGWFTPGWALLGGLFAVLRIGVFSFWANSYLGGAVAALGGILVLGALPRIKRRVALADVFWMALGIGLLTTTRLYEGLFVLLPVAFDLGLWIVKKGPLRFGTKLARFAVPMMAFMALLGAWSAYYNWRVTGQVTKFPYVLGREQYAVVGSFLWQPLRPVPHYRHPMLKKWFAGWEVSSYREVRNPKGYVKNQLRNLSTFWNFYVRPAFTLPLFWIAWAWRDRKIRLFLIINLVAIVGLGIETWFNNFYAAPLTGAIFAVVIQCMRHMRVWKLNKCQIGVFLVRSVPLICAAMFLVVALTFILGIKVQSHGNAWVSDFSPLHDRARLLTKLRQMPGQQLVIVRYAPVHNPAYEWVFNSANIDQSKVVWARDMGPLENQEIVDYFRRRHVWLVQPDAPNPSLQPYPSSPLTRMVK
jgi:hypothetical protein